MNRAFSDRDVLLAALERITAALMEARLLAIREPIASSPLVMCLQTAGGTIYQAQDALAKAKA